jgi:hypothetical protein
LIYNSQYFKTIKQAGYEYSKDSLGYYFTKGDKKFSIMKSGPLFKCYYNINNNGQWILQDNKSDFFDFEQCLIWILQKINN